MDRKFSIHEHNPSPCTECGKTENVYAKERKCEHPIAYTSYFISCHDCEIGTGGFDTLEKAIENWNQRL